MAEPHWDPKGPWPLQIFEKISIYICVCVCVCVYSRVNFNKKKVIFTILTKNLKWQVIIGCYVCAKKLFKLWIKIRTDNNLPLKIYCEIVVKIL